MPYLSGQVYLSASYSWPEVRSGKLLHFCKQPIAPESPENQTSDHNDSGEGFVTGSKAFNASSSALGRAVAKRAEVYVTPIPRGAGACFCSVVPFR